MAWFWWLLGVLVLIMWIAAIVDIIRRRHARTAGKTAAWILIVLILPIPMSQRHQRCRELFAAKELADFAPQLRVGAAKLK